MPRPRAGERIRGPYEDKSRGRWRTDEIAANGKRVTRHHASESAAERYIELWRASQETEERDTETALETYRRFLKQKDNKPDSIYRTTWSLRQFFPRPMTLSTLTEKRCKGLYDDLRTRPRKVQREGKWVTPDEGPPLAADSHRGALKEAKSFLEWCVEQGWLRENPAKGIKPIGKLRPRGKSLGKAGVKLRIREARAWYERALELAEAGDVGATAALMGLMLGMRANEIAKRQVRDLDTDEEPGDTFHIEGRKNDRDLANHVPAPLRPILLRLVEGKADDAPLWGKERSRWWVRGQVHRVCDLAGVPRVTAHALRGLLATLLLERGVAIDAVAGILGHDPKVTREHYAEPGAESRGAMRAGLQVLEGGRR